MSKATALTVSIELTTAELLNVADYVADFVYGEYGNTICECAGIVKRELIADIARDEVFLDKVTKLTKRYGMEFVDEPWDHLDYNFIVALPGGSRLIEHLDEMNDIIDEAERDSIDVEKVTKAVETLVMAGYTVSR